MLPGPRTPPAEPTPEGLRREEWALPGGQRRLSKSSWLLSRSFSEVHVRVTASRALNLHPPLAFIPGQGGSCSSSLQTKPCSFHRWEGQVAARRGTAARPQPGCVTSGAKGRGFGGQGWAVHLLKVTAAAQHPNLFRCSVCC